MSRSLSLLVAVATCIGLVTVGAAQSRSSSDEFNLPDSWVDKVKFRSIGPANMMGRITSIAVYEKDPSIWWAASASGGLIKTTNNGTTFEHQFDDQSTVSIGDVQVAQSDPNIVWVGSGESNPRNSVSWGNGVYKSTDGGKTWKNMGLEKGFQTGRIAIHPTNPDIVYVGVLGRLWGPNEDRGLYKTTDGGKSWDKVLYVDDKTGIIDVQMHPSNPDTLLIATYERQRDGFDGNDPMKKYGAGSGIYRTTDGGKSFEKLTQGLPTCKLGRVGLQYYRKDPKYVYAIVESEKIAQVPKNYPYLGISTESAEVGLRVTRVSRRSSAAEAGLKQDDILLEINGKAMTEPGNLQRDIAREFKAGDEIEMKIVREREYQTIKCKLVAAPSRNGRSSVRDFVGTLGGQAQDLQGTQWHDKEDGVPETEYGGIYMSADGGDSWKRINTLNPRPMYYSQLRVDPSDRNYIYVCGTSFYRSSDGGESFERVGRGVHPDNHALWINPENGKHQILGCDGGIYVTHDRCENYDHLNHVALGQFYHVGVGPGRDYYVYGGLQDNGSWGGPVHGRGGGILNTDWFRVGGGDGFICLVDPNDKDQIYFESQNGAMGRINLRTGERGFIRPTTGRGGARGGAGRGGQSRRVRYRFNWKTPFVLSPHNSKMHYSAGNYVFRSFDKGNGTRAISPEITNTDKGAGSAISESPSQQGVIYAGTTDGAVWMTRDGGENWTALFSTKPGKAVASAESENSSENSKESKSESKPEPEKEKPAESGAANSKVAAIKKAVEGSWVGSLGQGEFTIKLKVDAKGKITGVWETGRGEIEISSGEYSTDKKTLVLMGGNDRFEIEINAEMDGDSMSGDMDFNGGQFNREFEAKREKDGQAIPVARISQLEKWYLQSQADDTIAGEWNGQFIADFIPEGRGEFSMNLKMSKSGEVTGSYSSAQGEGEIVEGAFSKKTGKFSVVGENDDVRLEFSGTLKNGVMTGKIDVNGGMFVVDFKAEREGKESKEGKSEAKEEPKVEKKETAVAKQAKPEKKETKVEPKTTDAKEVKKAAKPAPGSLAALMPGPRWVSSIEASRYRPGRCYISFDGHRSNDDEPYVFVTENFGRTWKSIRANLPTAAGSVRCIREDVKNQNLLYLGCEFSAWVSVDRGKSWTRFAGGLPTVAVHEIAVHPTAGEIVMGTHGRSLWVADVTMLQQMTETIANRPAHLFAPNSVISFSRGQERGASGTRRFVGQNRPSSSDIFYHLGEEAQSSKIEILDIQGNVISAADGETDKGLHVYNWNLRRNSSNSRAGGRGRGGFRGRRFGGRPVSAGTYLVRLTVDGQVFKQSLTILPDPQSSETGIANEESDLFFEFQQALSGLLEDEGGEDDR